MSTSNKSLFISFEGIDGCGKSTQVQLLHDRLEARSAKVRIVREPGGTDISEKIRAILLNPDNQTITSKTEALLMTASRAQLTREIIYPLLNKGYHVLADRYADSTIAYQGGGRNLSFQDLKQINRFATDDLDPDITFFIDISPEDAIRRSGVFTPDRIEGAGLELQHQVRKAYLNIANENLKRFMVIDGYNSIDGIHSIIWDKIINYSHENS